MKRFIFIIVLCFSFIGGFALNTDSLKKVISSSKFADSVKKKAAIELMIKTWQDDPNFLTYIKLADSLEKAIADEELKAYVDLNYGQYYNFTDQYDSARKYLLRAYDYFKTTDNLRFLAASCGEMGNSYCFNGDYRQCLQWLLKAHEIITRVGDTPWIAVNLNNIGNVYYYLSDRQKAMEYYRKSYKLYLKTKIAQGIALTTNNLATVFLDLNRIDSAKKYYFIAVANAQKSNFIEQLTETYAHLSDLYLKLHKVDSANYYIRQSIKLAKESRNLNLLAENFRLLAQILSYQKKYDLAKIYLDSADALARKIGSQEIIKGVYLVRFEIDTMTNNYKSAINNYLRYTQLKDSLENEKTKKDIANLQSVYQLKLAEKENRLLKEEQEKQRLIIRQQRIIFISVFIVLIIVVFFTIILLRQNKLIKRINQELKAKNQEITKKNVILNHQKEEIIAQKEELERQHKELVRSQRKIQESINYARRIQRALLPEKEIFYKYFKDVLLFYLPRDVVSGDFYWATEIRGKLIFAAGDCTGHGVPGAFMSVMVITMLKEIINTNPHYTSAQILEFMREGIKKSLRQSEAKHLFMEGVDIAMCIYDPKDRTLNFAGAYRPLYLISGGELQIIKGDRQPVGIYIKEKSFTDNFIILQDDDTIYLFSDGYMDQLAAETLKKYTMTRFRQLLLKIYHLPMQEQERILLEELNDWRKSFPQIDDILILGLKV